MAQKNGTSLTKKQVAVIKAMLYMGVYQHVIAAMFGCNQGRISEIKNGHKHSDVQPATL